MNNRVVAIDPKKHLLWCVTKQPSGNLLCTATVPTYPILLDYMRMLKRIGVTHIAYETPYIQRNAKTYADLQHVLKMTNEVADEAGMTFEEVAPTTWQAAMLFKQGESARNVKRPEAKKRSLILASHIAHVKIHNEDLADAICIWRYATGNTDGDTYRSMNKCRKSNGARR